jgi:FHS family L-fucose permease-like MFS transporter
MGRIADPINYSWVFIVLAICYLYIFWFAVKGNTIRKAEFITHTK